MVTVDVEAQPRRATNDPVRSLIWGRFAEGQAGISEMMDVADQYGAKLTMFLDWCEQDNHGAAIDDVGREIARRGHDIQLHVHTDFLNSKFWETRGLTRQVDLNRLTQDQAEAVACEITSRQLRTTGVEPLAFRGGGYRYNASLLRSLFAKNIMLDSTVNISRRTQPVALAPSKQFVWSNNMLEVPVSCVRGYRNLTRDLDFNFNASGLPNAKSMLEYLEVFWRERGQDAIAVMVLHSWSFLKLNDQGTFEFDGARLVDKFSEFFQRLPTDVTVVSASEVVATHKKGLISLDQTLELPVDSPVESSPGPSKQITAFSIPKLTVERPSNLRCPICDKPKDDSFDMNGRRCSSCGSLERQRGLAIALDLELRDLFQLTGKAALIFSPAVSELRVLRERGVERFISADVRPETKADMIIDMCSMPEVATKSQELVFASYLMPVVHSLDDALDEVRRVLKPGGVFLSVEPVQEGKQTRETEDRAVQTGWYGAEALDKYKVGSFRTLGDADYLEQLSRRFHVVRSVVLDPITGSKVFVHACSKVDDPIATMVARPETDAAANEPGDRRLMTCNICKTPVEQSGDFGCNNCGSGPRARTLPDVVSKYILVLPATKKIGVFGASTCEMLFLEQNYQLALIDTLDPFLTSRTGVDSKQLFGAIAAFDLLEFAEDMQVVIGNCFAALESGGVAAISLPPYRLVAGDAAPQKVGPRIPVGYGIESGQSHSVGKDWLIKEFQSAGFEIEVVSIRDCVTNLSFPWLIGRKPVGNQATGAAASLQATISQTGCNVCGFDLAAVPPKALSCPGCGAAPRTRTLKTVADEIIPQMVSGLPFKEPLLAFAMTALERRLMSGCCEAFISVSLYGEYGQGHISGVDARNLSRFPDASFSGHFSVLLFDYFPEHEKALAEAARTVRDGGIFVHQISTARLVDGNVAPFTASIVKKRPGYFDYIPDDAEMPSIKVGIDWFVHAMSDAGFDAKHVTLIDRHSGEANHWFLGVRRPRSQSIGSGGGQIVVRNAASTVLSVEGARSVVVDCSKEQKLEFPVLIYEMKSTAQNRGMRLNVTVPQVPQSLRSTEFAEHVFDRKTDESTNDVIVVGTGFIGVSKDLGETWERIDVLGYETTRFFRCFTTNSGRKIVQAQGWLGRGDTPEPCLYHGLLFLFSPAWELLKVVKAGDAYWHGTASIDERDGIIMYAEYHDNGEKYQKGSNGLGGRAVRPCAVWRSLDDGENWHKVFEQDVDQIRHFHTLRSDGFLPSVWWASSGDLAIESRVWRSDDNGDTWSEFTHSDPDVSVGTSFRASTQAVQRYTDVVVASDYLLWGADDLLGTEAELELTLPISRRSGSRIYRSSKSAPLRIEEIGYVGQPVRNLIDVGAGWIVMTEGKSKYFSYQPSIFHLEKETMKLSKLTDVPNTRNLPTGFTHSLASRKANHGTFFTYRGSFDFLDGFPRIGKFSVEYIDA